MKFTPSCASSWVPCPPDMIATEKTSSLEITWINFAKEPLFLISWGLLLLVHDITKQTPIWSIFTRWSTFRESPRCWETEKSCQAPPSLTFSAMSLEHCVCMWNRTGMSGQLKFRNHQKIISLMPYLMNPVSRGSQSSSVPPLFSQFHS